MVEQTKTKLTMSSNETLADALVREGSTRQKSICTEKVLKLTESELESVIAGDDMGLDDADKQSLQALVHTRINNAQFILPWSGIKLGTKINPNW